MSKVRSRQTLEERLRDLSLRLGRLERVAPKGTDPATITVTQHREVGPQHTATGLTAGQTIVAIDPTNFIWAQLDLSQVTGVITNTQHGTRGSGEHTDSHSNANDPTSDQKDALGGTSGTAPSATDKYIDNADRRVADQVYAISYGVVADGSTNDTTALQNAVNAALSASKKLVLPPGTIMVDPGGVVVAGVADIEGAGRSLTTIKVRSSGVVLTLGNGTTAYNGGRLAGFGIDGNGFLGTVGIHQMDQVAQTDFDRIKITSCVVGVDNVDRNYSQGWKRCLIFNNKTNVKLIKRCQFTTFDDCMIYQTGALTETRTNVQVGDGTQLVTLVTFNDCDVEYGGATGFAVTNYLINGATVVVDGGYMESGGVAGSHDFEFVAPNVANPSIDSTLELIGVRSIGNNIATNWMVLPADDTTKVKVTGRALRVTGFLGPLITNSTRGNKYVPDLDNTGADGGIMIERRHRAMMSLETPWGGFGAARNYLENSDDLSVSGSAVGQWQTTHQGSAGDPVITADAVVAPDGTTTADLITFGTVTGSDRSILQQKTALTSQVGNTFVMAVYLRSDTNAMVDLCIFGSGEGGNDVQHQTIVVTPHWQRYFILHTIQSGGTGNVFARIVATGARMSGAQIYVWRATLDQGQYPGPALKTTSSPQSSTIAGLIMPDGTLVTSSPISVKDEGTLQGAVSTMDFVGAGVAAAVAGGVATITIPGGGGGGGSGSNHFAFFMG